MYRLGVLVHLEARWFLECLCWCYCGISVACWLLGTGDKMKEDTRAQKKWIKVEKLELLRVLISMDFSNLGALH